MLEVTKYYEHNTNIFLPSQVSFQKRLLRLRCLLEGCLVSASNRTNLWVHFAHRHTRDTIVIMEDDNQPYPRCPQCDMFVSHKDLNVLNITTYLFRRGLDIKWRRLAEEEARAGDETVITSYGIPLLPVTSFKYLGQILTAEDDDCPAVIRNLRKARR